LFHSCRSLTLPSNSEGTGQALRPLGTIPRVILRIATGLVNSVALASKLSRSTEGDGAVARDGRALLGGARSLSGWLNVRRHLCNQFDDRSVTRIVKVASLISEAQVDRLPSFIVSPRLSTGENWSPHEHRWNDFEEIHKVLLGSWRPRPVAVSVFLLRDLQEFAEFSDRFHTVSARDWRPGFPGGLFSNSSGRLRLALASAVRS
jgi:hypothetical protein